MGTEASAVDRLAEPDWRRGLDTVLSRPVSLVAALILAVVLSVVSFMLLTPPAIAGYYHAVRQSRREEYFIDLGNVLRTASLVLSGMGRCFLGSYVLAFAGLLPAAVLLVAPVLPVVAAGQDGVYASIALEILWLPAFFLAGVTVFNGYPRLVVTCDGIGSFAFAVRAGRTSPLLAMARGFMILFPIPAVAVHGLMVFTYPVLAAWALGGAVDTDLPRGETAARVGGTMRKLGLTLLLAAVMVGGFYIFVPLWQAVGFAVWLGICLLLALIFASRIGK